MPEKKILHTLRENNKIQELNNVSLIISTTGSKTSNHVKCQPWKCVPSVVPAIREDEAEE